MPSDLPFDYVGQFTENSVSPLSVCDPDSVVFIESDRVYRVASLDLWHTFLTIRKSGLLNSLIRQELIPKTCRSTIAFDGSLHLLEHEKVNTIIYPFEWSFEMLFDAGMLVLDLSDCLHAHGLRLKDCHAYNVLFHKGKPLYVDFGSITPLGYSSRFPGAMEQFIVNYVAPLEIWLNKCKFFAQMSLCSIGDESMTLSSWKFYRRGLPAVKCFTVVILLMEHFESFFWRMFRELYRMEFAYAFLDRIATFIPCGYWSLRSFPVRIYLENLRRSFRNYKNISISPESLSESEVARFYSQILDFVDGLRCKSAVYIGVKHALFSLNVIHMPDLLSFVAIDLESSAIDEAYISIRRKMPYNSSLSKITLAVSSLIPGANTSNPDISDRTCSEISYALGLIEYLVIKKEIRIEVVLKRLLSFTTKYLLISFIPNEDLGPASFSINSDFRYNSDWLECSLATHCKIIKKKCLEEGELLYLCEKDEFLVSV